jgi:GNAT superfamily N-acetyltransferase
MGERIALVATDEELRRCYPVMRELRPQLNEASFIARVQRQQASGYRLACLCAGGEVMALAGFRFGESLAWGRFLYVDDLVTRAAARSCGHGRRLLAWLHEQARLEGCEQLHLDSGVQREGAHRFYQREGMARAGYHFVTALD